MKYARIEDSIAIDILIIQDGFTLEDSVHADFVPLYSQVPDSVTANSTVDSKGKWAIVPSPEAQQTIGIKYEKVSPMTFQMLFTPTEEINIKKAVDSGDHPELAVWWSRLQDPRLTEVDLNLESVQKALSGLVQMQILSDDRKTEVLSAQVK